MKKISNLILAFIAVISFNACVEDDEPTFMIEPTQSTGPAITTANAAVTLDRDLKDFPAYTLVWDDASYNILTPITYTIEAGVGGTGFATPNVAAQTSSRSFSWTIEELNSLAISTGLADNTEGTLELRVVSSIGTNGGSSFESNAVVLTVTPYPAVIPQKDLFLVGNATAPGWENDGVAASTHPNPPLVRDPNNVNEFKYTGRLLGGSNAFKFLEVIGQWQPQWGTNDGSTLSVNDGSGSDPNPFSVGTDGYYEITANIEDNTFSIVAFDASSAPTYATIAIIGSSRTGDDTGWGGDDTDMTKSSFDEHLWYIQDVTLFDGVLKFRHSNDWPGNWGGTTAISGETTTAGDPPAIPVSAGTYDIWFNDLDGRYIFIVK
ncbi:SusE domain-containing protein [Aquimarina sp. MMG016]|uniref:SusF/SusE family outer membrane protein n=1 Tax=Aquimarina sp. MMG016 TaxID=2822690 RepID=UPI001B3A1203|nr:SusE domain-containing protein [Aquimarina sp. MMG016]MBQ4821099.1 SusE domain-containing protein [Aquimarina sp. MMG016]